MFRFPVVKKPFEAKAAFFQKYVFSLSFFPPVCVLLFSACAAGPFTVALKNGDSFPAEKNWLLETIAGSAEIETLGFRAAVTGDKSLNEEAAEKSADIFIELFGYWEFQNEKSENVLISKTWFVPRADPLSGRRNTSLSLCVEGGETLVPAAGLAPPYTALRVDGRAADDRAYPLVRCVGARLVVNEEKKVPAKKIAALEKYLRALSGPLVKKRPALTWISAAGDIMPGRGAESVLLNEGAASLFGGAAEILESSDITLVNLEGPLSVRGEAERKTFTFQFEPPGRIAAALKGAGISAVLFANNHAFDYGPEAFLDSLAFLEEAGIGVLGAGRNREEALRPFVYKKENFSARLWGLASFQREKSGWDGLEYAAGDKSAGYLHTAKGGAEALAARLNETASPDDNVLDIVMFHGGAEWSLSPDEATRKLLSGLVDAGADLIIGSHPHMVQGFEWFGEKPVFWSLGNFVFAGMENTGGGDSGLLVRLGYCGSRLLYMEAFALSLSGPRIDLAPDAEAEKFYRQSRELSQGTAQ